MKNVILASLFLSMISMSSAFASSMEARLSEGKDMVKDGYVSTGVPDIEKLRMPINTLFKTSVELFDSYYTKAFSNADYNNFFASVEGKSDEEVEQAFANLSPEMQASINKVRDANTDINDAMLNAVVEIAAQNEVFSSLSPTSALSSLSMWNMPKAIKAFGKTGEEISFIYDSIVEITRINSILDAQSTAL